VVLGDVQQQTPDLECLSDLYSGSSTRTIGSRLLTVSWISSIAISVTSVGSTPRHIATPTDLERLDINFTCTSLKAISPVGIHVSVPWGLSVCLSRSCIVLKRQKLSSIDTTFFTYDSPCLSEIVLKFGLHWSTPFSPNFATSDPQ